MQDGIELDGTLTERNLRLDGRDKSTQERKLEITVWKNAVTDSLKTLKLVDEGGQRNLIFLTTYHEN